MVLEQAKDRVARGVINTILKGIETEKIHPNDAQKIASLALSKLNAIRNEFELPRIYAELAEKWPIFLTLETIEKGIVDRKEEHEVIQGALHLIEHGKIDQAVESIKRETGDDV